MRRPILACLLPLLALWPAWLGHAQAPTHGTLTLVATGLADRPGVLRFALYDTAIGFPDEPAQALLAVEGTRQGDSAWATFTNLPHGTYAGVVLHDANGNGRMDRHWLGLPREGWGTTQPGTPSRLVAPTFEEAAFRFRTHGQRQRLQVVYFF